MKQEQQRTNLFFRHFNYCVFYIVLLYSVSLGQEQTVLYHEIEITPINFGRFSYMDRTSILLLVYKNRAITNSFLKPLPATDLDSMIVEAQQRIHYYENWSGLGTSPETIKQYIEQLREVKSNIDEFRIATSRPAQVADEKESPEMLFQKCNLEDKLSSLALMVEMPKMFVKFYELLTTSERDSALIVVDKMISDHKTYGPALGLPQPIIAKEVNDDTILKKKLMSLQTKK